MSQNAPPSADVELLEMRDFLRAHPPFDQLHGDELARIARQIVISYARKGRLILAHGVRNNAFYIVRSGAVDLHEDGSSFHARVGEGDYFAFSSLLRDDVTRMAVTAVEDCLLYQLPGPVFIDLIARHPALARYFAIKEADRLRDALERRSKGALGIKDTPLLTTSLARLIRRPVVHSNAPDASIAAVARQMADQDCSTMLLVEEGRLVGIFTDKDLRRRVVGRGLSPDRPVREVMTPEPITLPESAGALEALLLMTRHTIHHLPVTGADGSVRGIVSANDILSRMSSQAVYLADRIGRASDPAAVAEETAAIPDCLVTLVGSGVPSKDVGRFLSSVGEAAHRRLAELAEAELGPPPVPYALMVFGSLARADQTAKSDQDNGLILDNAYDPEAHGGYFAALAKRLADGLDQAGYAYCSGDIMATNPSWRQPLSGWVRQFRHWITEPDPKAVMNTTIFFDLRGVHGEAALIAQLTEEIRALARENRIFLAHMTRDALTSPVPLGFFRQLVLSRDKAHRDTLNLKLQGTAPIVDIARIYALAAGVAAVNSLDRLTGAEQAQALAPSDAANLRDAFDFISDVRLRHQAACIEAGQAPDNFVSPKDLSRFDRDHLKDAFAIVRDAQQGVAMKYARGLVS